MTSRTTSLVLAAAVTAVAVAASPSAGPALAQEPPAQESVREKVERLFPDLGAERDEVRERAERDLFALGEPARRELERISRDTDPKRAITALRLLGRDDWDRTRPGEERARPDGNPRDSVPPSLREWEADLERRMAEMRRRFDEMQRRFREDLPDWPKSFEFGIEDGAPPGAASGGSSSGRIVTGDRSLAWTIDEKGRVKVTTKDGKDAEETTVEAESMDQLRKEHPDLAKRLDEVSPRGGVRRWVLRVPQGGRGWSPWTGEESERDDGVPPLPEVPLARPALGIEWQPLPDVLREHLDLPEGGIVVEKVLPESLAARLGLRRFDVLLDVAGRKVADAADVRAAVEEVKPGDPVAVTILRKGRRETLSANR